MFFTRLESQSTSRISNSHLDNLLSVDTQACQQRQELPLQMVVAFATITVQVLLHTDVEREQDLVFKALFNELDNVARPYLIGRVTISFVTDVVNAEEHALLRDLAEMVRAKAIPEMADHDPLWRHAFFPKQCNLFQSQLAEMRRVSPNRYAGQPLSPGGCSKHALLCRSDVIALSSNLTDDTGTNSCAIDTLGDVSGDLLRQLISTEFIYIPRISFLSIPGAAHHNVNADFLRDPQQPFRIASQADAGNLNQCLSSSFFETCQLGGSQFLVVENAIITPDNRPQIANQMFMRQDKPSIRGKDRSFDCHDDHSLLLEVATLPSLDLTSTQNQTNLLQCSKPGADVTARRVNHARFEGTVNEFFQFTHFLSTRV